MKRNAFKNGLSMALLVIDVVVLAGLLLCVAATCFSCSSTLGSHAPRPPRGKYTLDQAQRYVERMNTPAMRNRGYRQVKP